MKLRVGCNGIGPVKNSQSDDFTKTNVKSQIRATNPSNMANFIEFGFQPNGISAVPRIEARPKILVCIYERTSVTAASQTQPFHKFSYHFMLL